MKRSILGVVFALAATLATGVSAGGTTTSKVAEFGLIPANNLVWVKMVGPVSTQAACATANYFVVNIGTETGKAVFRMLMAGQVQGLPLTIVGTGQCTATNGLEDILYVLYNPPT